MHQAHEFYFDLSCDQNRFLHFSFLGSDGFRRVYSAISLDLLINDLAQAIWRRHPEPETRTALKQILEGRLLAYRKEHPASMTCAELSREPRKEKPCPGESSGDPVPAETEGEGPGVDEGAHRAD